LIQQRCRIASFDLGVFRGELARKLGTNPRWEKKEGKMKVVFFSAIAGVILFAGCISRHERVVEKETERPVVRERVIEKAPDTTINVNK
jgi:hypothetical protein